MLLFLYMKCNKQAELQKVEPGSRIASRERTLGKKQEGYTTSIDRNRPFG